MLVHHYRGTCRTLTAAKCRLEINDAYHDDVIVRHYANDVTPRVEHVLKQLGYFEWMNGTRMDAK